MNTLYELEGGLMNTLYELEGGLMANNCPGPNLSSQNDFSGLLALFLPWYSVSMLNACNNNIKLENKAFICQQKGVTMTLFSHILEKKKNFMPS